MKRLQTNLAVKIVLVVLTLACGTAVLGGGCYVLRHWDSLFGRTYTQSSSYFTTLYNYRNQLVDLLVSVSSIQRQGGTYLQDSSVQAQLEALDADATNFRYVVRSNDTGEILLSNTGGLSLEGLGGVRDMGIGLYELYSETPEPTEEAPEVTSTSTSEGSGESPSESEGSQSLAVQTTAIPILPALVVVEYGVLDPLVCEDEFWVGREEFQSTGDPAWLVFTFVSLAATAVFTLLLCYATGHKKGVEGPWLNWQDRIPYEPYLLVTLTLAGVCASGAIQSLVYYTSWWEDEYLLLFLLAGVTAGGLLLAVLLSTVARVKARTLLRNTLICRFGGLVGRWLRAMADALPLSWRFALGFVVFLMVNAILSFGFFRSYNTGFYFLGLLCFNAAVLWAGCRWCAQWRTLRDGTGAIVGGDPTAQIDTDHMYPDLRGHAEALNHLGEAINSAVEQRMKSERFKAELITNVSHDLKTPLTSIINYVDLLKKEDIDNPKALEYLEVLDRKSQRLKKLTEDLVEASKASTGNVTVSPDRMDLAEFTQQAAAEYQDRLDAQRLTLISRMPDTPVHILADGRHMWRILDNLLGNCVKYALEGTRVYLEVVEWDGKASISLKNISRDPLSADPETLTERFVRGDESRTTEGSGLGLSIARSLTEVQGGTFRITTDGDLFKVSVYFPAVP